MQSIDIPMFDDVKLIESSDSLELALAQMGKYSLGNDTSFNSNILSRPSAIGTGNGFDDWLAADLNFGALSSDESSLSSSPFSGMEDSPDLGFDSYGSMDPSLFDMSMAFPALTSEDTAVLPEPEMPAVSVPGLTASAVQQAAAALNIPWSKDLEKAVMAQAAMGAIAVPAPAPVEAAPATPLSQTMDSPMLIPKDEPVESDFSSLSSSESVSSRSVSLSPSPSPSPEASSQSSSSTPKKSKKRVLTPEEREEEIVAKRAKNTDAARRSRLKKLIRLEGLEAKVSDLESANSALNMKIAILETEKTGYLTKEAEQAARIDQLEAQLAEAHAALARI
ncbi:hypothetical protein EMPS_07501 [Entomortierella parvispora]|uniref:BZIP domain-containing protein n=1 Tax=Entomortierella parvispora TaxID=205924 RepID=A0A9P3LYI2_9FUNG|nr:hypothetical protein EMPS_07501 [Entomortierella parvispora]